MKIIYPDNCVTEASRLSFCFRLDELLRLEHNEMGAKYREGLINKAEWENYLKNTFESKSRAIHAGINENKALAEKGVFWPADLSKNLTEVI